MLSSKYTSHPQPDEIPRQALVQLLARQRRILVEGIQLCLRSRRIERRVSEGRRKRLLLLYSLLCYRRPLPGSP
ncbi:hypothetical protein SUGI_1120960 [Cryptomeria japonica]|nr:hypothetical protein SUGI_1120960 [Cryptomeria japonica]